MKCYKDEAGKLLAGLEKPAKTGDPVKDKKKLSAYNYIKRSLELMAQGNAGAIDFDRKTGKVLGAASMISRKGVMRINTLGSLGGYDPKTNSTAGMRVLAECYRQSLDHKKLVVYAENAEAYVFYEKYGGRSLNPKDALDMTVERGHVEGFGAWMQEELEKVYK